MMKGHWGPDGMSTMNEYVDIRKLVLKLAIEYKITIFDEDNVYGDLFKFSRNIEGGSFNLSPGIDPDSFDLPAGSNDEKPFVAASVGRMQYMLEHARIGNPSDLSACARSTHPYLKHIGGHSVVDPYREGSEEQMARYPRINHNLEAHHYHTVMKGQGISPVVRVPQICPILVC